MQFVIYKDRAGQWRWQLQAANNRVIADSAEGYNNRTDCEHGIQLVRSASMAPLVEGSL